VTVKYDLTTGPETEEPKVRVEFSDGTPPYPVWAGMGHGVVSIDFVATKPGRVTIWGFVNKKPESDAGSDLATIQVKVCKYSYTLTANLHVSPVIIGISAEWENIFESKGTFILSFADPPYKYKNDLTGKVNVLHWYSYNVNLPDSCEPKPTDFTYKETPGGKVFVSGRGFGSSDKYLNLRVVFGNPTVGGVSSVTMHCLGVSSPPAEVPLLNVFPQMDSWITEEFPKEGGTRELRIPAFDEIVRDMKKKGGNASYTAKLEVKIDDTQPSP
jgi:hypothetical protein